MRVEVPSFCLQHEVRVVFHSSAQSIAKILEEDTPTLHWEAVLSRDIAKCQQEPHEFRDERRALEMWGCHPHLSSPFLSLLWKSPSLLPLQNHPARTSRPLCWGYTQGSMLSSTGQPCAAELVMLLVLRCSEMIFLAKINSHFPSSHLGTHLELLPAPPHS